MNKDELKKVQQFIDSENFTAKISDCNCDENFTEFDVSVDIKSKSTYFSYNFSIENYFSNENGAYDILFDLLREFGFDTGFIRDNIFEISEIISEQLGAHKIYDAYIGLTNEKGTRL